MKIMPIFGTRPECIKIAPVIQELNRHQGCQVIPCLTGQHRDMAKNILDFFKISPAIDLDLMVRNQNPLKFLINCLSKLDEVLDKHKPDWVLVQGDTSTVMAGSLAAFHKKIKIGHIEAGLRSFDKWNPFPEEVNRKIAGVVADLNFCPSETSKYNLLAEAYVEDSIVITGNTVIDALHLVKNRFSEISVPSIPNIDPSKKIILVTLHRRESFGEPLENICLALSRLAREYSNSVQIIYPVHPNPNVRDAAERYLSNIDNLLLVEPLGYFEFLKLMNESFFVVTDSGGIQEEAPCLGKPVLVCRNVTERPEGVTVGVAKLVGTSGDTLYQAARELLNSEEVYLKMARQVNLYGDGLASKKIVEAIKNFGQRR